MYVKKHHRPLSSPKSLQLSWQNVSVSSNNTPILKGLSGRIYNNQFLTVMGPSGSGKSTFLQFLTGRVGNFKGLNVSGDKFINKQPYTISSFNKFGVFVRQDDVLFACLTVYQTIQFQANLKIKSQGERVAKINNIINTLGLEECRNVRIGGQLIKGISGGQRKRTAIAIQLISDPQCIVLDEPTSGLDSHNALIIIKILCKLASQNKLVIATIHQPSSVIFSNLDQLLVIKAGQTLYFGESNKIIDYMETLGISVNKHMNPADFFILQISEFKAKNPYLTPMTAKAYEDYSSLYPILQHPLQSTQIDLKKTGRNSEVFKPGFLLECKYLTMRALKNYVRNPINQFGKIMNIILMPIFITSLYKGLGDSQPRTPLEYQVFMQDYACSMFLCLFCSLGLNIYDTVLIFTLQKQVFYRESSSHLYNTLTYFFTRYIIEIPGILLPPIIICCITYFSLALPNDWDTFAIFFSAYLLIAIAGSNFGLIMGCFFNDSNIAVSLLPVTLIPMILFGGLIAKLTSINKIISWMQYISPLRYGFNAVIISQMRKYDFMEQIDWKQQMGLDDEWLKNLMYLGAECIILLILALICLKLKQKKI